MVHTVMLQHQTKIVFFSSQFCFQIYLKNVQILIFIFVDLFQLLTLLVQPRASLWRIGSIILLQADIQTRV